MSICLHVNKITIDGRNLEYGSYSKIVDLYQILERIRYPVEVIYLMTYWIFSYKLGLFWTLNRDKWM